VLYFFFQSNSHSSPVDEEKLFFMEESQKTYAEGMRELEE
jgi:hypothetical protein